MRGRMKDNLITLARLTQRGLKIFLKDRMGVFFALLAPLIVLLLYVLFLGDIQVDTVKNAFQGFPVDDKLVGNFVDAWMLAGVMSVACITVSFSAQTIMVSDRENNTLSDMLASPVPRSLVSVGYLVANIAVTLVICLIVECVAFVYMAASGWTLSVGDTFLIVAHTVLSVISSSTLSTLICSGIKTASQHGAFVGILSAVIGFLVGAYMPLSVFPKGVQYITLFIPGTYSAGVYRNLFMRGALADIEEVFPAGAAGLRDSFSMDIDFFGTKIGVDTQAWILCGFVALTFLVWLTVEIVAAVRRSHRAAETTDNDVESDTFEG